MGSSGHGRFLGEIGKLNIDGVAYHVASDE